MIRKTHSEAVYKWGLVSIYFFLVGQQKSPGKEITQLLVHQSICMQFLSSNEAAVKQVPINYYQYFNVGRYIWQLFLFYCCQPNSSWNWQMTVFTQGFNTVAFEIDAPTILFCLEKLFNRMMMIENPNQVQQLKTTTKNYIQHHSLLLYVLFIIESFCRR